MKKWLKENIFVKDMFIYILVAAFIFYTPLWLTGVISYVLANPIYLGFGTAYVLIWAGPFTPTIPVILAIAVFLKKIVQKIRKQDE
ncbi:MAG: hypothetical protein K9L74_00025 [Candidatus Izimaplasma sp.]|nr:hypothetical protein [Candidatus Izimaplasma bacterium]